MKHYGIGLQWVVVDIAPGYRVGLQKFISKMGAHGETAVNGVTCTHFKAEIQATLVNLNIRRFLA